jgi:preprotein translocase subunit SecY
LIQIYAHAWNVPEIRKRLLYVLMMFVIFVAGANVPIPGTHPESIMRFWERPGGAGGIFELLNMFGGGALKRFSIFALGIMPYINASIIFNLLVVVFPTLKELQKEGESGRKKIAAWTRYLTVVLAAVQAMGMLILFRSQGLFGVFGTEEAAFSVFINYFIVVITLVAGTMLLLWMGELISENGVGNGVSLLIFAGIISRLPVQFVQDFLSRRSDPNALRDLIFFVLLFVGMIWFVVYVHTAERRIPIHYARRQVGRRYYEGHTHYLPLKVNQAGVIPIIFAVSVLLFPSTIATFMPPNSRAYQMIQGFPNSVYYYILYAILIGIFTYFYTAVTFDPKDVSDNLKKNGGFIQGIRPGPQTQRYLEKILEKTTFIGALFLIAVAVIPPAIFQRFLPGLQTMSLVGGTSILIVVGVALDTVRELDARLTMMKYESAIQ